MTVTTEVKTQYKTFAWQTIRKMAAEAGVPFYSNATYKHNQGVGFKASRFNADRIYIAGYENSYRDVNEFMHNRIQNLANQNFMLKLELWALKNNVQFEMVEEKSTYSTERYIKIVQA